MMKLLQRLILAYARFLFLPILQLVTLTSFLAGGNWLWAGVAAYLLVAIVSDEIGGDTTITDKDEASFFHDGLLYLSVILMTVEMFVLAWFAGSSDFLNLGALANTGFGVDLFLAREATNTLALVGAVLSVGVNLAGAAGGAGHELMHRVNSRVEFAAGQWVLALCAYSSFMIEHVYGHHRNVGLARDCGTAWRGMSLWRHILRSFTRCHLNAPRYENDRLSRKGHNWLHYKNRALQGHLMAGFIGLVFYASAGWPGVVAFAGSAIVAIFIIEAFSYLGHYGLVRAPGKSIHPRHSWNSYSGVLTGLLFNLPRHSSHHASANRRYWQLEQEADAPVMPYGVSAMALIAMVPSLYYRVVGASLEDWDNRLATQEERQLIPEQTKRIT